MAKLQGSREMAAFLRSEAKAAPLRFAGAIYRVGSHIMTRSQRDFVPVQYGALRDSGRVQAPKREGTNIYVDLTYGGPAIPYAFAVHEHPSKASPPSWRGRRVTFHPSGHGPQYLTRPVVEASGTFLPDLMREVAM